MKEKVFNFLDNIDLTIIVSDVGKTVYEIMNIIQDIFGVQTINDPDIKGMLFDKVTPNEFIEYLESKYTINFDENKYIISTNEIEYS